MNQQELEALQKEIDSLIRQHTNNGFDKFDALLGMLLGLYVQAPTQAKIHMTARFVQVIKDEFNIDLAPVSPTMMADMKRKRVEEELMS